MSKAKSKLRKCPSCDHDVSQRAKTCPNCGEKLTKPRWLLKGVLGVVFLLILLLELSNEPTDVATSEGGSAEPQAETLESQVDLATWDQCKENAAAFQQLCENKQVVWMGVITSMTDRRKIDLDSEDFGKLRLALSRDIDVTQTPENTRVRFAARIVDTGGLFSRPSLDEGEILEVVQSAEDVVAEREAAERAEEERLAAEAANSCVGNLDLCTSTEEFFEKSGYRAGWQVICSDMASRQSKYGKIKWGEGFLTSVPFESVEAGEWNVDEPVVTLVDRDARVPNAFGTLERLSFFCTFNPKSGDLLELRAE